MAEPRLRAARPEDFPAILRLNQAHETETSPLSEAALAALMAQAFAALVIDGGQGAVLIALDQDAVYGSPNFLWFRERYERFVYVDRVIVAASARGEGFGRRLYESLFSAMWQANQALLACEVNIVPPNPVSDAFHIAMNFVEIGRAALSGDKVVRYLMHRLEKPP